MPDHHVAFLSPFCPRPVPLTAGACKHGFDEPTSGGYPRSNSLSA
ncbi:MAG: hypothetical protein AVDCRST_MAG31-1008 [uncultured Sphingomonas sp.]|uniref:Uncharacterized protein n=1 Tax=uncultured Sphingomonas sp. TaxID=158754 RepID=A0A6J4T0E9_9SPHN|nr:MAG: hypothetical protein AVDCRST_MAG31-1008 [uncultured Sphingomonas sp.]